jgi:transcriptional regulator with XRE-family HTH domain
MADSLANIPFARLLRAMRLRKGLKQADLAKQVNSSTSVISRAERGTRLPDRYTAARLDEALEADGELLSRWLAGVGAPTERPVPATMWVHNYPAAYHGVVWMRWLAAGEDDLEDLAIEVTWGPWRLRRRLRWPPSREVTVWHTKGDDGLSIPVVVRSSRPIVVSFFVGDPPPQATEINAGWKQ